MCRHFTHFSFSVCGHTFPIPQAFPYYIPPQYCSTVTDALNHYHTQPDRMPEQFPIPFPRACPVETAENITVEVLGLCENCAAEVARRRVFGKPSTGRQGRNEDGRNREAPNGASKQEPRPGAGNADLADMGKNRAHRPGPRTSLLADGAAPERIDQQDDAILAKGPVIVTTPEVIGAWWRDGTSMKCQAWTSDKNGRRRTKSWTMRAGVRA